MKESDKLALHGKVPRRSRGWPTYEDGTPEFGEDILQAVAHVLRSRRLFRYDTRPIQDTASGQFEQALRAHFGSKHALAVSSGTAALAVSLMALNLKKGFRVACPAFGFPATASAILLAGGLPIVVGVDKNLHFDLCSLSEIDQGDIDAVIVVHMRGFSSAVESIVDYCLERRIPLIEDVVPALGVRHNGRLLGTFGTVGCFSTQADKTINTGEGGFIITDDVGLFERMVLLSGAFEGRALKHIPSLTLSALEPNVPLYNFRIDELRSAIAHRQLLRLDNTVERYKARYDYVTSRLSELALCGFRVREASSGDGYLGDALIFFVEEGRADFYASALRAEGIKARSFVETAPPNVRAFWNWGFASQGWYERLRNPSAPGSLEPSRKAISSAVDVPLTPTLVEDDLDDLVSAMEKVFASV
jgi:dTDP-4-amino-4,6-dideoxygalactose transaminase